LSLVAVADSRVLADILFTRVTIRDTDRAHDALALAPVAVLPRHQKQGIGSALVRHGRSRSPGVRGRVGCTAVSSGRIGRTGASATGWYRGWNSVGVERASCSLRLAP
jgi:putative acetyltransferase